MMRANMNMRLVCASLLFIHAAAAAAAAHAPNRHVPSANQLHKAHAAMVAATKLLPADQALAERVIFESEGLWFGDDDEAQQHFQAWCDHLQDEHRRQAPYHQERPWAMTGSTSSTARRSLAEEAARLQEPQVGEITSQQDVRDALSGIAGEEQEAPAAQALAARWSAPMCQDTLASNAGAASPCTYDCAELQAQFFPGDWNPDRDSCYLYNQFTASWPQALLDRKKTQLVKKKTLPRAKYSRFLVTRLLCGIYLSSLVLSFARILPTYSGSWVFKDWHIFLEADPATDGSALLTIGDGRSCTNVTIVTMMAAGADSTGEADVDAHVPTETHCLLDGYHEHLHGVEAEHSLEIIGYTDNATYSAGATSSFVVGDCTDITIRLVTTRSADSSSASMNWTMDDNGHNGPWNFTFPSAAGTHEHEICSFDNEFTLTLVTQRAGWEGNISVLSIVEDNTIYVPADQNLIIQGIVSNGLPVSLDARISSGQRETTVGGPSNLSHANSKTRKSNTSATCITEFVCLCSCTAQLSNQWPRSHLRQGVYYADCQHPVRVARNAHVLRHIDSHETRGRVVKNSGDPAPRLGGAFCEIMARKCP